MGGVPAPSAPDDEGVEQEGGNGAEGGREEHGQGGSEAETLQDEGMPQDWLAEAEVRAASGEGVCLFGERGRGPLRRGVVSIARGARDWPHPNSAICCSPSPFPRSRSRFLSSPPLLSPGFPPSSLAAT